MNLKEKVFSKFPVWCFIVFAAMCLLHYFSLRPLWLDEQFILNNIQDYNYVQVFGPLKNLQAFPRVYLVVVKAFSQAFDYHLLSLRFFSLVFMLGAFVIWIKLYQRQWQDKVGIFLSILSFTVSYQLVYYSAELKPYSMDVLAVGLFCLFFYYQQQFVSKSPTAWLYCTSILLPFLIFFSYAGCFVFWMVGYNFIILIRDNKKLIPVFLVNAAVSLLCLALLYFIDLRHGMYMNGFYQYWKNYFLGINSFTAFITPFGEALKEIGTWWYGNTKLLIRMATPFLPLLVFSLAKYGFGGWKKNGWGIFTIPRMFGVLFVELIILSICHKYPFTGDRITLFLAPFVFYMIVKGIDSLRKIKILHAICFGYYLFFLGVCLVSSFLHYLSLYKQ